MSKYKSLSEALIVNGSKQCSVRGCMKNRHRVSKYCSSHLHQKSQYGHPLARAIKPKDFEIEKRQVEELINMNHDHGGIQYGIQFLEDYLKGAAQGITYGPCGDLMAKVYEAGVRGRELLGVCGALYVLQSGQRRLVKSDQHLTYLVGHHTIMLASQGKRIRGRERQAIGKYIQGNIGILLVNICRSVEAMETKRNQSIKVMSQSLVLD